MFRIIIPLVFLFNTSISQGNQIAVTFDDAPKGDGHIYSGQDRTDMIISTLDKFDTKAAFFVNPKRFDYSGRRDRIIDYSNAGHFIANHTYSHPDLRTTDPAAYVENIIKADQMIRMFPTYRKWFRFPYLREGDTVQDRDWVRNHLRNTGYINGYVTVDNYDFYIDDLVQKALSRGDKVDLNKVCGMFTDVIWDGIEFYNSISVKYIGKIRHTLLLHETDVVAHCLPKLLGHLKANNWTIISADQAYMDTLLNREPDTLYLGQGRVAAIIHEETGKKYKSKWESTSALKSEFSRRKVSSRSN